MNGSSHNADKQKIIDQRKNDFYLKDIKFKNKK